MEGAGDSVLVVDDDPLFLEIIAQQLEGLGVRRVLKAERAEQALRWLKEGQAVGTVITDLAMPEVDGPRFLHQLADLGLRARVVLISAARPDILHSILSLGQSLGLRMAGSLQKPVALQALQEMLLAPGAEVVEVRAPVQARSFGAQDLRVALQSRQIRPWYQPKLDARHLRVVGVEALARWLREDGSMVSPAEFVPAIEAQGLSWELFVCMLEQVLADVSAWHRAGWPLKAAVNLSMDCTDRLDLPEQIAERTAAAGLPLSALSLEVTESRLMNDRAAALETLSRLSLMGATLSIDDFGTGYSSLAQLADLPFGELKIDASFVRRMGQDRKMDRILQTLMAFGRGLGIDVVAEGVEHYRQLLGLRQLGASVIQGYLIARPMSEAKLRVWLGAWRPGLLQGGPRYAPLRALCLGGPLAEVGWHTLLQRWPDLIRHPDMSMEQALSLEGGVDLLLAPGAQTERSTDLLALLDRWPTACVVLLEAEPGGAAIEQALALSALVAGWPLSPAQLDRVAHHFDAGRTS
jgi:EAL domain-containing protein (putative c-di-GMP-specific phosphodiesterase class I)